MTPHYNFADFFELAADKVPDRVAVVDRRRRITYRDLEARANALAHALQARGVQPGDHVGILATNCIEWVEQPWRRRQAETTAKSAKHLQSERVERTYPDPARRYRNGLFETLSHLVCRAIGEG